MLIYDLIIEKKDIEKLTALNENYRLAMDPHKIIIEFLIFYPFFNQY